ncbi:MAG: malonic semialdehyde reductase [Deltaproteobacteria bacterium]|jgi:3-hydroxypropanoate dehydrogenase|nr:malonic semialdehyde reductase [Deltaproteobacteria bacterium]
MSPALNQTALETLFLNARTFNQYLPKEVSDQTLRSLINLLKWGPTAVNCQPGRFVFVKGKAAKEKLILALNPGNIPKVTSAPVTVIVAQDRRFYEYLPEQWKPYDAAAPFRADENLREQTAFRNSSLQGAYLIIAARALGLDCGPMSGFDNRIVDREFFPEGRYQSNFLVNLGYGEPDGYYPRGPRLDFNEVAQIL